MKHLALITLVFSSSFLFGQDVTNKSVPYSRSSIATIFLDYNSGSPDAFNFVDSVRIPEKFDYNFFGNNRLNVDIPMVGPFRSQYNDLYARVSQTKDAETLKSLYAQIAALKSNLDIEDSLRKKEITQKINQSRLPAKILSSILIDSKQGFMTTSVLDQRSEYNATDGEFIAAMNSERKISAIREKGLNLLQNLYFIIYETNSYQVKQQENSNASNYSLSGVSYLYKVKMDSLINNGIFDQMVFVERDPQKETDFTNYDFPFELVSSASFGGSTSNSGAMDLKASGKALVKSLLSSSTSGKSVENTQVTVTLRPDEEVYKDLLSSAVSSSSEAFTKSYVPFQVKSPVFAAKPIQIKIGRKEGIHIDDLFKITELRQDKNGEKYFKTIGWIRAKKISDNRQVANGNMTPSKFYKVGSGKVEKGMLATYKPESFSLAVQYYSASEKNSLIGGTSFYLETVSHFSKGLKFGINLGGFGSVTSANAYDFGDRKINGLNLSGTNIEADLTINQTFQLNRFELTPFVGYGLSMVAVSKVNGVKLKEGDEGYNSNATASGLAYGAKFGINLSRAIQLQLGYKTLSFGSSELKNKDNESFSDVKSIDFNPSTAVFAGLRILAF